MPVDHKAVLSTFHVSSTHSLCIANMPIRIPLLCRSILPYLREVVSSSYIAMGSPSARPPTPLKPKTKKKPDYVLVLLYCLMYLELSWLIVMIWRSCH